MALFVAAGLLAAAAVTAPDPGLAVEGAAFTDPQGGPDGADLYAAWFDARPLTGSAPLAGAALLLLAGLAAIGGAVRVARTPAQAPLVHQPWLAAAGVAVAVSPWLIWSSFALETGFPSPASGWTVLGWVAWLVVLGGAGMVLLAATPPRRRAAGLPLLIGTIAGVRWLTADVHELPEDTHVVALLVLPTALAAATALALRPTGPASRPSPRTLLLAIGAAVLLAGPCGVWEIAAVPFPWPEEGEEEGVLGLIQTGSAVELRTLWDAVPALAALSTAAALACAGAAVLALRGSDGRRLDSRQAALLAGGAAIAASAWLEWSSLTTGWWLMGLEGWLLLAGGALVAATATLRPDRRLAALPLALVAATLADGGVRAIEADVPPAGGALLALGAAVLVCAVLLRRPTDGGTL